MNKIASFVCLVVTFAFSGCNSSSATSVGASGPGLTGQDALNSISGFQVQEQRPIFQWQSNSANDMNYVIQECEGRDCFPIYKIECGNGACQPSDSRRTDGSLLSHSIKENDNNGSRTFRLEICDSSSLGLGPDATIQIQAQSPDGSGAWVTAQMTSFPADDDCNVRIPEFKMPEMSQISILPE